MLSVIIMAAGKGTRMKSNLPKVLHKISGKEMLYYSINEAKKLSNDISVVVYHQKEKVIKTINKYFEDINFITQDHENFPGTGGAVKCCEPKNEKRSFDVISVFDERKSIFLLMSLIKNGKL
jgi:bifunctional UDP-N-acetylglucosamine pyrophosphorylase/glucosamine-1-phosphate N-acetyltransferase